MAPRPTLPHAYFLYAREKRLTPTAQKRPRTIYQATELGAGFNIAMKDLEIRGAGNLLGHEQSGFIYQVGFDLYCRMFKEVVEEEKHLLLKGSPEQLVPVSERKLTICKRLEELKAERARAMRAAGLDPEAAGALDQLINAAPPSGRHGLKALVEKARALARNVARVGENNKLYLQEALDTVEKVLAILTGAEQPKGYGQHPPRALGPRLVAKEV